MTSLLLLILVLGFVAFFSTKIGSAIIDYFSFYIEGQKYRFSASELKLLWKVAKKADLKNRTRLFWSVSALNEAITLLTQQTETVTDEKEKAKLTTLLSKLYSFRTKVELENVQSRRGLESTAQIKLGQVCVLVFMELGQFYATVIENTGHAIKLRSVSEIPKAFNFNYTGDVSVYIWRTGDAGYIFKTRVLNIEQTNAGTIFTLAPSKNIIRTQKRKSVRAPANFEALLFLQHPDTAANTLPEHINGVKCRVKDISEDGAQVIVKGKSVGGMRAKLQFELANTQVVMFVKTIRFVYSSSQHLSKIHFACEKISDESRNAILSYVYQINTDNESQDKTATEETAESGFDGLL